MTFRGTLSKLLHNIFKGKKYFLKGNDIGVRESRETREHTPSQNICGCVT